MNEIYNSIFVSENTEILGCETIITTHVCLLIKKTCNKKLFRLMFMRYINTNLTLSVHINGNWSLNYYRLNFAPGELFPDEY